MTDDEDRLRTLLLDAAPDFGPLDPATLHHRSDPRPHRLRAPLAAAAAVLAVVAGIVALVHVMGGTANQTASQHRATVSSAAADSLARRAPCATTKVSTDLARQPRIRSLRVAVAVQCEYVPLTLADGTSWKVLIRQVSADGLPALLTALTAPDDPTPPGTKCASAGAPPLDLVLADPDGHYLHPAWPRTTCDGPSDAVSAALAHLVWRTVSITKLTPFTPETTPGDPCDGQHESELTTHTRATPAPATSPIDVICVFDTVDDRGDGYAYQNFDPNGTDDGFAGLVAAFAGDGLTGASPPAGSSCPHQNRYLLVHRQDGSMTTVEVGGCWRVVRRGAHPALVGTADRAARAAVTAALDR